MKQVILGHVEGQLKWILDMQNKSPTEQAVNDIELVRDALERDAKHRINLGDMSNHIALNAFARILSRQLPAEKSGEAVNEGLREALKYYATDCEPAEGYHKAADGLVARNALAAAANFPTPREIRNEAYEKIEDLCSGIANEPRHTKGERDGARMVAASIRALKTKGDGS